MKIPILKSVPEAVAKENEYIQWGLNGMRNIVTFTSNIDNLEKMKIDFNNMPYEHRQRADEESLRLFNKTNLQRYEEFKAMILARDIPKDSRQEKDSTSSVMYTTESVEDDRMDYSRIKYTDKEVEVAKKWSFDANRSIITPTKSVNDLDKSWVNFKSTTRKQQRESDWKSLEVFGIDNETHYNYLKSRLLKQDIPDATTAEVSNDGNDYVVTTETYVEKKCRFLKSLDYKKDAEYITEAVELLESLELSNYDKVVFDTFTSSLEEQKKKIFDNTIVNIPTIYNNCLLFFTPDELQALSVFDDKNTTSWFESYKLAFNNIYDDKFYKLQEDRIQTVRELMGKLEYVDDNDKDAIKLKIIENGWNPEYPLTEKNIRMAADRISSIQKKNNGTFTFVDISESVKLIPDDDIGKPRVERPVHDDNVDLLWPVYIVLLEDATIFSKDIRKVTNGPYSHVALGFNYDLKQLYSFNFSNKRGGGVSRESISRYPQDKSLAVYSIFVKESDFNSFIALVDGYLDNRDSTSYSYASMVSMLFNIPIDRGDFKLVCSQFVDKLLKFNDIDITKKDTSLVSPNDFYRASKANKHIYTVYEGPVNGYNADKVLKYLNKIQSTAKCIKEGMVFEPNENELLFIRPVQEVKEFPVQFDKEGNLLIKKIEKLDYNAEYAKSHKLLLEYEKSNNIEGIKYEVAKLWFMNNKLEQIIHKNPNKDNMAAFFSVRALILNDFKKYMGIALNIDKDFNFTVYYDSTPFSDNVRRVNSSTLRFTVEYLKSIL